MKKSWVKESTSFLPERVPHPLQSGEYATTELTRNLFLISQSAFQRLKVMFLLLRQLALRVRNDRQDQSIIVAQEPFALLRIRAGTFASFDEKRFVLVPESSQTARYGLVVASFVADGENAVEKLAESLRKIMRSCGLLCCVRSIACE